MEFLIFLVLVILLAAVFVRLLFTVRVNLFFHFDTDKDILNLTATWLYPFIKAQIAVNAKKFILIVYLFRRKIFRKAIVAKGTRIKIPSINLEDAKAEVYYGGSPFYIGIAYGVISLLSQFMKRAEIVQYPAFLSGSDYIRIDATAKINGGETLLSMLRARFKGKPTNRRNNKWIKQTI